MASGHAEKRAATYYLLWENSSPGSSFAAQTIPLDLSAFDSVMIDSWFSTATQRVIPATFFKVGEDFALCSGYGGGNRIGSRYGGSSTTGITFEAGYYNGAQADTSLIPLRIYGVKGI